LASCIGKGGQIIADIMYCYNNSDAAHITCCIGLQIDMSIVVLMTDNDLATYLPLQGDRYACREFCLKNHAAQRPSKREALIEKLKSRLQANESNVTESVPSKRPRWKALSGNANAKKSTRIIELGWIHKSTRNNRQQVRAKNGGGTRKVMLEKTSSKGDIAAKARQLFFPNDISIFGKWEEFAVDVTDFQQRSLPSEMTIDELYVSSGMPLLRYYLMTERCDSHAAEETVTSRYSLRSTASSATVGSAHVVSCYNLQCHACAARIC